MKSIGFFGPLGGIALAALILFATLRLTPTDHPLRWLGFVVAVFVFVGGIWLGKGQRK